MKPDIIIVGCGFSGAVCARILGDKNLNILIIEQRDHIAGNMYEDRRENGVLVQKYGPHIFHTSKKSVVEFIENFSNWRPYIHKVLAKIGSLEIPVPFNFSSMETLISEDTEKLKNKLSEIFPGQTRISVLDLIEHSDPDLKKLGELIYETVFVNYTAKQWMCPAEQVDKSVINRVPVVLGYEDSYFSDDFQKMPDLGFTKLFENLLNHPRITVELGKNFCTTVKLDFEEGDLFFLGEKFTNPVIYTGSIDELAGFSLGELPYISIDMLFEDHKKNLYQNAAVVNYPNEEKFTRITEFKYLTGERDPLNTTIMKEYPKECKRQSANPDIPYYPIITDANRKLYDSYRKLISKVKNLHFCGRLGEYRYLNMDDAIESAIKLSSEILETTM